MNAAAGTPVAAAAPATGWVTPFGRRTAAARPTPLDPTRIATNAAFILGLLLLNLGGTVGSGAFFLILLVMALYGPSSAFKAMAICYLGLLLNQAIVPKTLVWTPGRLVLPFVVLLRYSIDLFGTPRLLFARGYYLALLLFAATMAACSIASGWYTHIALFKLANFTVFTTATLLLAAILKDRKHDLSEWFVSLIVATTMIGFTAVATGSSRNFDVHRGVDGLRAEGFFNGAFLHPNVHALYASMMLMFLACLFILAPYRNRWLTLPLVITWLTFMVYSQSRTSVFAVGISFLVLVLLAAPRTLRAGRQLKANVRRSTLLLVMVASVFAVGVFDLASGRLVSRAVIGFLHKWDAKDAETLDTEQMLASRQGLIDMGWANFLENRWTGIGFQVAKTQAFVDMATLFTAPAEKGFLPVAILEEGGILGASAFVIFLLTLLGTWYRERNIPAIVVMSAFLVSNLGEATMLAPGGGGAFGWIMVGAATILGDNCWTWISKGDASARRRSGAKLPPRPLAPVWPDQRAASMANAAMPRSPAGHPSPGGG